MSRTKKNPYTKSKRFDKSCRNHGGCPYCLSNRLHKHHKKLWPFKKELTKDEL